LPKFRSSKLEQPVSRVIDKTSAKAFILFTD